MKKQRKPMQPIICKKLSFTKFKINESLFKQAAGLSKYKGVSLFSLLNDYLVIGIVSASEDIVRGLGTEAWVKYYETAWEEINKAEKPLPRFKKRNIEPPQQPEKLTEVQPEA